MAVPLVNASREKISVVLVQDEVLLDANEKVNAPIVHIRRQGEGVKLKMEEGQSSTEEVAVNAASGRYPAVVVTFARKSVVQPEKLIQVLTSFHNTTDLMEPFERLTNALKEVERQKAFKE